MQTDAEPTTTITAGATPEPKATRNMLVRHMGLNRKARRTRQSIALHGNPGIETVKAAKSDLKNTPTNFPVRKVVVNGRSAYVFEPHYFAGLAEYKASMEKSIENFDATAEAPDKSKAAYWGFAEQSASQAFIDKIVELTQVPTPQPA